LSLASLQTKKIQLAILVEIRAVLRREKKTIFGVVDMFQSG
jgi:hypothetical protein